MEGHKAQPETPQPFTAAKLLMVEFPAHSGRTKDNLDPETLSLGSWQKRSLANSGPGGTEVQLGVEGAKHGEFAKIFSSKLLSNGLKTQHQGSN